jgi:hypothetical protein
LELARASSSRVDEARRTNWSCKIHPTAPNKTVIATEVESRILHNKDTDAGLEVSMGLTYFFGLA